MAIAFDASATGVQVSGTSLTYAHTCTGSNLYLVVAAFTSSDSDQVTGVTYNGVAMTRINTFQGLGGAGGISLYGLASPSTGANNIVISASATTYIRGQSASYTGVAAAGQPDSNNNGTTLANTVATASTTVVATDCWTVATSAASGGSYTSFSGTSRQNTGEPMALQDSNGTVATGSQSLTFTNGSSVNHIWGMVSLAPAAAAATTTRRRMLLGIGA